MSQNKVVAIVGAGHAGFHVASELRSRGFTGAIDLLGQEPETPYQRPPLSKTFLDFNRPEPNLRFRSETYLVQNEIGFRGGVSVTAVDRDRRRVKLSDGETLGYDALVLATGARVRRLALPGMTTGDTGRILDLRTIRDARLLKSRMESASTIAIVGGGFVGLEVAAAASATPGRDIHVFEVQDRILSRLVSSELSGFLQAAHTEWGTKFHLNSNITSAQTRGNDGLQLNWRESAREPTQSLDADVVVAGIGVIAETQLAEDAGLEVNDGIVVNSRLRTDDPNIFAVGDCVRFPDADTGHLVRIESVQNALGQAKCVAANIIGGEAIYQDVPWFWSDQRDIKLQMVGSHRDHTHMVRRGSPDDLNFSHIYFRGDQLIAVDSVNRPGDFVAGRKLIEQGSPLSPDQASDPDTPLKAWIALRR